MIVCHCEHTEKTLFFCTCFVPLLCLFSSAFLPLFFLPLRADEKQATERNVDFWLHFGTVLASAPSYRALRYGSPPRTFPGITADTGKKGFFDTVLIRFCPKGKAQNCPHLARSLPSYHCRTFTTLLPHSSPVFRIVFAALKPIKRRLHAPARNDVRLSQILKRCELHAAVNNSGCFLACQCLLIVERTEDHDESAEIFDLQRVQLLDCCPQLLRGKIRSG